MPQNTIDITFAEYRVIEADPMRYPAAHGKANGYFCPLGAQPGIGYVLVDRITLGKLHEGRNTARQLRFSAGANSITIKSLYTISATKVSGGVSGGPNAVFMLKLADKRWLARMSDTCRLINVRCPAPPATSGADLYHEDSLDGASTYTWNKACEVIWGDCPILGSYPGLPFDPDGIPEGFSFIGVPTLDALMTVLGKINCTLGFNPETDEFDIVRCGASQASFDEAKAANSKYLADAEPTSMTAVAIPQTIRVYFHGTEKHYGTEKATQQASGNWLTENSYHKVDVPTEDSAAVAGTVVSLWDDLPALFKFDGTLDNESALEDRAIARAETWLADARPERFRRLYSGVALGFTPGSQVKAVHWRNVDSRPNSESLVTEVIVCPGEIVLPDMFATMQGAGAVGELLPSKLATPDFGRATTPNYPPLIQLVCTDGSGGDLTAATGNVWSGQVLRTNPAGNFGDDQDPYESLEACWICLPNQLTGGDITGMKLPAGDRYLARLSGSHTRSGESGDDIRPLYEIYRGENFIFPVTWSGTCAVGASKTVTLPDGRSVSAQNATSQTLSSPGTAYLNMHDSTWHLEGAGSGEGGGGGGEGVIVTIYTPGTAGSGCMWPGRVATPSGASAYCTDQFPDGAACLLVVLNEDVGSASRIKAKLQVGDHYPGIAIGEIEGVPVYAIRVDNGRPAETIEGYVTTPFDKQQDAFEIEISEVYRGWWPNVPGVAATDATWHQIINPDNRIEPEEGEPPEPYLFEGEVNAFVRANLDWEASLAKSAVHGAPHLVYRAAVVQCPKEPVEMGEGSGNYVAPLTMYGAGGQSELVSNYYYGDS